MSELSVCRTTELCDFFECMESLFKSKRGGLVGRWHIRWQCRELVVLENFGTLTRSLSSNWRKKRAAHDRNYFFVQSSENQQKMSWEVSKFHDTLLISSAQSSFARVRCHRCTDRRTSPEPTTTRRTMTFSFLSSSPPRDLMRTFADFSIQLKDKKSRYCARG